jgi:hypothetical protein
MDPPIIQLTGLSAAEVALLTAAGTTNAEELTGLTHDDIREILPQTSVGTRRKLSQVAEYLSSGKTIADIVANSPTMLEIHRYLSDRANPAPIQLPPHPPAEQDPARGAPRMSINGLEEFSGVANEWLDWHMGAIATVGQSAYAEFLDNPPDPDNEAKKIRNKEFFNMLAKATNGGAASHLVQKHLNDGYAALKELCSWYDGAAVSRQIIDHFRTKLNALQLDENITATAYINNFIIYNDKLEAKNEGVSAESKRETFIDKITDEDYDTTVQIIRTSPALTFDECVLMIRTREQSLGIDDKNTSRRRARRTVDIDDDDSVEYSNNKARRFTDREGSDKNGKRLIPSLPNKLLYSIRPKSAMQNLIKWRGIYNSEGREIRPDEYQTEDSTPTYAKYQKGGNSKGPNNKSRDTKRNGPKDESEETKKAAGSKALTAKVFFKDNVLEDDSQHGDDDESLEIDSETIIGSSKKNPARSKKGRRNPVIRRGRVADEAPRAIIDPGTDYELLGGVGWKILGYHGRSTKLDGALAGMSGGELPVVSAATAYDHPDKRIGTIVLVIGSAAFDDRTEETLLNSLAAQVW